MHSPFEFIWHILILSEFTRKSKYAVINLVKDYRGFNFGQQMAVSQNQWRLNGAKIVDKTHAMSMRKICNKPNARTYDLRVFIPGSAEKQKIAQKWYRDLPKKSFQWSNFFMCVSMEHKILIFQIFPTDNFLIFFAD